MWLQTCNGILMQQIDESITDHLQGRWAKQPQELYLVAYIFNPSFFYEGLNQHNTAVGRRRLSSYIVEMYKAILGNELSQSQRTDITKQVRAFKFITLPASIVKSHHFLQLN